MTRLRCDQCEILSINGIACHETGCPNQGARYDREAEEWVKQYECRECGNMVDRDTQSLCCGRED